MMNWRCRQRAEIVLHPEHMECLRMPQPFVAEMTASSQQECLAGVLHLDYIYALDSQRLSHRCKPGQHHLDATCAAPRSRTQSKREISMIILQQAKGLTENQAHLAVCS